MLPAVIRTKFASRNCGLRKSAFSTVIMLTTNLCRFSICFLRDRQQNGNVKRSEFVEFDGRKWEKVEQMFEVSRYLSQELSDVGLNISPHRVSVALFSASSAKNASFFLVMNNLCLFDLTSLHGSYSS